MVTMNSKTYDKLIEELVAKIKSDAVPFKASDPISIAQRSHRALSDYEFFAATYFPQHISKPFGAFHKEILAASNEPKTITAIAAPRAHGKTINLAIIKPIWLMLRGDVHFFVAVAENEDLAKERTGSIAAELAYNERLLMDFGLSLPNVWADDDYIVRGSCRCLALGYRQPIRGKTFGHYRPDYIVIDDFESHQATNLRIAKEKLAYVREEAFGALPMEDDKGIIIWLGNLTHADSALNLFKKACEEDHTNNQIRFILRKAILEDGTPLWAEAFTLEALRTIEQAIGSIGFQRHYMMNPITEGIKFLTEWFRYYDRLPDRFDSIVTYCDPSLSAKATADYKAVITLGLADRKNYILDCWIRRASITAMLLKLYSLDKQFSTRIFMESTLWQKVLWEFIPPLSDTQGYLLPVTGIDNKLPKDQRIESITPLFEWGWVLFPANKTTDTLLLEEQLLGFPSHPNDDGPDALAGALDALKNFGRPMEYRSLSSNKSNKFNGL